MIKKTNKDLILYMSVVIFDDSGRVEVYCEALMIGKTFDAYKFMLDTCFRMVPSVKRDEIHCIFCNEFLSNNFSEEMKLSKTSLFLSLPLGS